MSDEKPRKKYSKGEKKFVSMLDTLRLRRKPKAPPLSIQAEETKHKLNEFTQSPIRYVRRDNHQVAVFKGRNKIAKFQVSGYQVIEHRDMYDTRDATNRKIMVPSDESVVIIIGKHYDIKNEIGRKLRQSGAKSISTLEDTVRETLGAGYSEGEQET